MTNFIKGNRLFAEAERIFQDLDRLYKDGEWNLTIRRSQEVIELSLKALLRMMGVDYPKEHDVGKIFGDVVKQKGLETDAALLEEIKSISAWLTNERAPAFYYDKEYTEEKAKKAKEYADRVLNFGREFKKVLAPQEALREK